jgi:hypothetical protein
MKKQLLVQCFGPKSVIGDELHQKCDVFSTLKKIMSHISRKKTLEGATWQ